MLSSVTFFCPFYSVLIFTSVGWRWWNQSSHVEKEPQRYSSRNAHQNSYTKQKINRNNAPPILNNIIRENKERTRLEVLKAHRQHWIRQSPFEQVGFPNCRVRERVRETEKVLKRERDEEVGEVLVTKTEVQLLFSEPARFVYHGRRGAG